MVAASVDSVEVIAAHGRPPSPCVRSPQVLEGPSPTALPAAAASAELNTVSVLPH